MDQYDTLCKGTPAGEPCLEPRRTNSEHCVLHHQACSETTKKGTPCQIEAGASGKCHVHDPALQCGAPKNASGSKRCTTATGGGPCFRHGGKPDAPVRDGIPGPPSCPRCVKPMKVRSWHVYGQPKGTHVATCSTCSGAILC